MLNGGLALGRGVVQDLAARLLHLGQLALAAGVHLLAFLNARAPLVQHLHDGFDAEDNNDGHEDGKADEVRDEGLRVQPEARGEFREVEG